MRELGGLGDRDPASQLVAWRVFPTAHSAQRRTQTPKAEAAAGVARDHQQRLAVFEVGSGTGRSRALQRAKAATVPITSIALQADLGSGTMMLAAPESPISVR